MLSRNNKSAKANLMPAALRFESVGLRKPAQPSCDGIPCRHTFYLWIGGIPQIRHRTYGAAPNHSCDRFVGPAAPRDGALTPPE